MAGKSQNNWVQLEGINTVLKNIEKQLVKINKNAVRGMKEAAAYIRYDMDVTSPTIPVRTGNLRQSWFITPLGRKGLIMGFGANYAVFVHERVKGDKWGKGVVGNVNWSRSGSGPKFFEAALKRNEQHMLEIIGKYVEIK